MAGIYIHIPFCKQACYYCNFHFSASKKGHAEMVLAILKELELKKSQLLGKPIESIYLGGGTPSILSTADIAAIIQNITANYAVQEDAEISLEANPDDLTNAKLLGWKASGINRLSIGIQSFFDEDLKWMNRAHSAREASIGLELVKSHFDNYTIDLIYGIPGMNHDRWKENLEIAMAYNVPHISSYALTIEPRTVFGNHKSKGKLNEMDEDEMLTQFNMLVAETEKNGLIHYEISNFGKPSYFSRHNMSYWQGKQYIGIGPAAHSFNGKERSWNIANNSKYVKAIMHDKLPATVEQLSQTDRYNEYVMTGLRTQWGIELEKIAEQFGIETLSHLEKQSKKLLAAELLVKKKRDDGKSQLLISKKGKFLADGIASDLFIV